MIDILVILDRSGSMQDARSDHEGGLRSFVADQQKDPDAYFTLVQFDDKDPCEIVYDRVRIREVGEIALIPRGGTPLLDAIGKALAHLVAKQQDAPSEATIVMIITDGEENASREWRRDQVKARIEELTKAGWTFLFLGANVDAFDEAGGLGVALANAANYANAPGMAAGGYVMTSAKLSRSRSSLLGESGPEAVRSFSSAMAFTADEQSAILRGNKAVASLVDAQQAGEPGKEE